MAALALCGVVCIVVGAALQQHSHEPPLHVSPVSAPHLSAAPTVDAMPQALPTRLEIPAIGVRSPLLQLGQQPDGTMAVPPPGPHYDDAGWYRYSPEPGTRGPAVIAGHVDSARNGQSVFYRLGALRPGDLVLVSRSDGTTARFAVDGVASYPKSQFPTALVYGDTAGPELRLITCGGAFDRRTGHYLDNTVVSAHLIGRNRTSYQVVVKASNPLS